MQLDWEEAHSVALRECVEKGMTFSEAARTLNERFGTAYSRNAAIGRARRMGLSSPEPADRVARARPPKSTAVRLNKLRQRAVSGSPAKADIRERAAALQLRCVAITPRHLALVELEAGDCRYPYGGMPRASPSRFAAIRAVTGQAIASRIFT